MTHKELEAALIKYGDHKYNCALKRGYGIVEECDCGYSKVFFKLDKVKEILGSGKRSRL